MSDADEDVSTLGMGATPVDPRAAPSTTAAPSPPPQAPAHAGCASCTLATRETAAPYPALWLFVAALVARRARLTFRRRSGSRS
jgi:hypothetical protein